VGEASLERFSADNIWGLMPRRNEKKKSFFLFFHFFLEGKKDDMSMPRRNEKKIFDFFSFFISSWKERRMT